MSKIISSFFLITFLSLYSIAANSQKSVVRFGVTLGATNYITDTNLLFSKSQPGFETGIVASQIYNDHFELMIGINYDRHYMKFVGRETPEAPPEDLKFMLENLNIPITLNYNFWVVSDDLQFGVNTGPSLSFFHNYKLLDENKSGYYLDPLYADPDDLAFDTQNSKVSFNVFYSVGLSAEYKKLMLMARYYTSLTDPYRQASIYSTVSEIKGRDSYYTLALTYFFDFRN
ncbi:hypothetical protein FNO01nite_28590 [Flavobacterium noncentrifugens]|uniref:Outer membrane protein beta-barrel domain-containing protein n=1 Tax=Flavobacterium noncentrifugens TaxID=1128970 RepID=A0A1G8XV52_9FLAO|nr:outer membrane beta-barrel protein [Flavobacterium noncentrifugens]GEP52187.1 hypothetical protein FNO01nite_28590 [Flavobacterium noncentrifugens]SDJ94054.1 Outer membrane protein beta-barrel domain-containing protein [Flavobacterium noncentrifugens]